MTGETRTAPASDPLARPGATAGRFVSGTVLADRYRIVGLLGRGGMGEVYRADDLKLDQPVALKFLPETLGLSPAVLARFHGEVRIARQVSHPNVCRVYDIGGVDGLHFLTMEFIDGEDLASLLRRIGRLPPDKAVEIARQLCAGLAAAHDAGVLHRDLKPANVMIDGRGRARITDFGVAAIAREIRSETALAGTPAYMAPEQLKGQDASVRSDVYALGLVLYEIVTGKRAVNVGSLAEALLHHTSGAEVTTPSSWIQDVDPAVERAILRCLEADPARRPASAIQVAASLPGGDPLQAALLAGETPSPEMVAASGSAGALRLPTAAAMCLAALVLLIVANVASGRLSALAGIAGDLSTDVLVRQARQVFADFGYSDRPRDTASGLERDAAYVAWDRANRPDAGRIERLSQGRPPVLHFWYRESPAPLVVQLPTDLGPPRVVPVLPDNPPASGPGMRGLRLDPAGRLLQFRAVPSSVPEPSSARIDWGRLFSAAGLDRRAFQPAPPEWVPPDPFDEQAAWIGTYPGRSDMPLRLEAAAYGGRLVAFRIVAPWSGTSALTLDSPVGLPILIVQVIGACLAWLNIRAGRGDRRGAARIGWLLFGVSAAASLLVVNHVSSTAEAALLRHVIGQSLLTAVVGYLLYLASEPYLRRHWPTILVAWARVVSGRLRDPLVGREALVGATFATVMAALPPLLSWILSRPTDSTDRLINSVLSLRGFAAAAATTVVFSISTALIYAVGILVLRILLRNTAAAGMVAVLLFVALTSGGAPFGLFVVQPVVYVSLSVVALTRFGLLALASYLATLGVLSLLRASFALTGGDAWIVLALVCAFLVYASWLAIGSPRLVAAPAQR